MNYHIKPSQPGSQPNPVAYTPQPSKHCFTRIAPFLVLHPTLAITNRLDTADTATTEEFLEFVEWEPTALSDSTLVIPERFCSSRTVLYLLPALLQKFSRIEFADTPQGCSIGKRAIDWHLDIAKQFGVETADGAISRGKNYCRQSKTIEVEIRNQSFTSTHWAIVFAMQNDSPVFISNINRKPETMWLLEQLRLNGAHVEHFGAGVIVAPAAFYSKPVTVELPYDRNDVVLAACASLVANTEVTIQLDRWSEIGPLLFEFLEPIGVKFEYRSSRQLRIPKQQAWRSNKRVLKIDGVTSRGFCTDWMPIAMATMSYRQGKSFVFEHVFEQRLKQVCKSVSEINPRLVWDVSKDNMTAILTMDETISPNNEAVVAVEANDIRHGGALMIAAIGQRRRVIVTNTTQIRRGYADIVSQLNPFCNNRIEEEEEL